VAKRRSPTKKTPARGSDGTRYIFWLNMLMVFALVVLLVLGQWDFLLAGVLVFFVLNGLLGGK
jgi:hypothetical protein